ncbi:MAG TPA: hypothetical protein DD727_03185, partial [Clostridiales bacterium]|nr:hypothetical protein [Clostridiales bacterium]
MRKHLRIPALMTIVLLCLTMNLGCKKQQSSASATKAPTTAAKATTATVKTTAAKTTAVQTTTGSAAQEEVQGGQQEQTGTVPKEEDIIEVEEGTFQERTYDLQGRTIRWVTWHQNQIPPASKIPDPANVYSESMIKSLEDVEAQYNCKIEFSIMAAVTREQTLLPNILAGTDFPEIFYNNHYEAFPRHYSWGALLPLSDYYDFDADPRWNDLPLFKQWGTWAGKIYGIPGNHHVQGPGYALWYNKTIFNQEG